MGCDRARPKPWLLPCVHCSGRGCAWCDGTRGEQIDRCPQFLVRTSGVEAFIGWYCLVRAGDGGAAWPNAGGLLEQPASFLEAMRVVDGELGAIRKTALEILKPSHG